MSCSDGLRVMWSPRGVLLVLFFVSLQMFVLSLTRLFDSPYIHSRVFVTDATGNFIYVIFAWQRPDSPASHVPQHEEEVFWSVLNSFSSLKIRNSSLALLFMGFSRHRPISTSFLFMSSVQSCFTRSTYDSHTTSVSSLDGQYFSPFLTVLCDTPACLAIVLKDFGGSARLFFRQSR